MDIIIGCDPEVFVCNRSGFIPARVVAPNLGDKDHPTDFGDDTNGQIDGMALEFGITPTANPNIFVERVRQALRHFDDLARSHSSDNQLALVPVANFLFDNWRDQVNPADFELGCSPDFNAYSGRRNIIPKNVPPGFRTAAGHIHIGWTSNEDPFSPGHLADCRDVVKQLDAMFQGFAPDNRPLEKSRRRLYGKAGAFRPKPYGVEYRVPSNSWLKSPALVWQVHELTMRAVQDLAAGEFYPEHLGIDVRQVINSGSSKMTLHRANNIPTRLAYPRPPVVMWWRD